MDIQAFIEQIARGAGAITLKYYNSPSLTIETKSNDTPVTQADKQAEAYLRTEIKKHFPNDAIIGEEFGEETSSNDVRWILDPLDGTKTFIHGVPFYGTLIAREEGDTVTHGCVYLPALNELVYAERNQGCWWNGSRCHGSEVSRTEAISLVTTDHQRLVNRFGRDTISNLIEEVGLYRTWGDCYGHVLVATGRADLMLDAQCAVWDIAPFAVIMDEAGAHYESFSGERTIRGGDLISCSLPLKDRLKSLLTASGRPF
jgi:histidinol-phosphatase